MIKQQVQWEASGHWEVSLFGGESHGELVAWLIGVDGMYVPKPFSFQGLSLYDYCHEALESYELHTFEPYSYAFVTEPLRIGVLRGYRLLPADYRKITSLAYQACADDYFVVMRHKETLEEKVIRIELACSQANACDIAQILCGFDWWPMSVTHRGWTSQHTDGV